MPTSINPKPQYAKSLNISAFLSNPAAIPTGFLNFNPNTVLSNFGSSRTNNFLKIIRVKPNFNRNLSKKVVK